MMASRTPMPTAPDSPDALELDRHSRVLMFSTEGNTDPEKYRRVVWDGEYPTDDTPQKPC